MMAAPYSDWGWKVPPPADDDERDAYRRVGIEGLIRFRADRDQITRRIAEREAREQAGL